MAKKSSVFFFIFIVAALIVSLSAVIEAEEEEAGEGGHGRRAGFPTPWPFLVKKGERKTTVKTEKGEVSTVRISDGIANGWYHIEFITLEPNSVFLPVLLQADMVFYVHTGSGRISWTDEDETKKVELRRGDIYRLRPGTLFYIESSLEMEPQKLRIYALFANAETDLHEPAATGPYTSIRNLILGFDRTVLEAAFGISGEPIEELVSSPDPGAIVHGFSNEKKTTVVVFEFMKGILGSSSIFQIQSNKKKTKTYNVFSHDPDFENCNGWSTIVSKKHLSALKDLDVSVFMVNLTKGSMMGPHWNPRATELGICLFGPGIVTVVCSSAAKKTGCKNMRFYVEEGDVFAVPRFHPMAQMAFNNHSFVFMGFSTSAKNNHPQYLAGKASALRTLPRDVVAVSFGASNETMDLVLDKQELAIILECTSCAEEELRIMTQEIEKAKEEARKKKEEEERKREEEEKREQEEAKRAEEEEAARQKEAKEREEQEKEEAEREKQEERKREEEERKQEEAKRAEEEEARKEEAARQREKKAKEEAARRAEEEAARRAGEEAARRAKEEEARKEEEAEREKQEEARRAEEEEARKEEEVRQREAKERAEEQAREREKQEEAAARRAEEEARQREAEKREEQPRPEAAQEEETRWAEEEEARKEGEAMQREAKKREEAARQQEQEMQQQHHEGGGGWGDHPGKEWGRRILKT